MLPFLHDRLHQLNLLLAESSEALSHYASHDADLARRVLDHLHSAVAGYRQLGLAGPENEMLALQAQFVSARDGTDPFTLTAVTTRRRTLERTVALHVLTGGAARLRCDRDQVIRQLDEGRGQVRGLVLNALALGVLQPGELPLADQAAVERLWRAIVAHPDLGLAARQLATGLNATDVLLLIEEVAATLPP